MKKNPLDFFEFQKLIPRNEQEFAIKAVRDNWDKYDYFLLDLPTGVGKTNVGSSIAYSAGRAYMLTSTLQLQDQYQASWKEIVNLKGRSNYTCALNEDFTVDAAPCIVAKEIIADCKINGRCPYINQKNKALAANAMITNPLYLLYSKHCGVLSDEEKDEWNERDVIVIDEAHNTEKHLISFAEIKIDLKEVALSHNVNIQHLFFTNDNAHNYNVLQELLDILLTRQSELNTQLTELFPGKQSNQTINSWAKRINKSVSDKVQKLNSKIYALDKFVQPMNIFFKSCPEYSESDLSWLIHYFQEDGSLQLAPMNAGYLFDEYLKPLGKKFIFMSATLGNKTEFCKTLGLDESKTLYIQTDTPFPPEKSPIIVLPQLKMGYKDLEETIPKIAPMIEQILDLHENERGIIHCATYKLQGEIYRRLSDKHKKRILCRDMDIISGTSSKKYSNVELLDIHSTASDTILLSPSMMEGVDLYDDLSTFQIILKMPWPSLANPRINKLSKMSDSWYSNQVWMHIMQAAGRSTRHVNDESVTYMLDASFNYFYKKWKMNLPNWFTKRINQ